MSKSRNSLLDLGVFSVMVFLAPAQLFICGDLGLIQILIHTFNTSKQGNRGAANVKYNGKVYLAGLDIVRISFR
jgi:hypothetical protein